MGIGHADAAMHLHHLVGDEVHDSLALALASEHKLRHVVGVVVDGGERRLDAGARELEIGEHLGGAMLQRLERADHLAELHAGLQIFERDFEGLRRLPSISAARPARARSSIASRTSIALIDATQHASAPTSTLSNARLATPRLSTLFRFWRVKPFALPGTRNSVMPFCVARLAARARGNDEHIGRAAIEHEGLLAGELPAVAGFRRRQRDLLRRVMRAFVDGERARSLCLPRSSAASSAFCASLPPSSSAVVAVERRRDQWRRRQRAAGLFEHQTQRQITEPRAAEFLRNENAGPAHLGHLAPSGAVEAVVHCRCRASCGTR